MDNTLILNTILQYKPKESHILLDIGGNDGTHSIFYSKNLPNCSILTFEPNQMLYSIINSTIDINRLTNIQTFNKAVGHKNQDEMIRLDDLNLHGCDYMKIITGGYESLVLHGAMDLIHTYKPVIVFEHSKKHLNPTITSQFGMYSWAIETPFEILKEEGYLIQPLSECYYLAKHIESD